MDKLSSSCLASIQVEEQSSNHEHLDEKCRACHNIVWILYSDIRHILRSYDQLIRTLFKKTIFLAGVDIFEGLLTSGLRWSSALGRCATGKSIFEESKQWLSTLKISMTSYLKKMWKGSPMSSYIKTNAWQKSLSMGSLHLYNNARRMKSNKASQNQEHLGIWAEASIERLIRISK